MWKKLQNWWKYDRPASFWDWVLDMDDDHWWFRPLGALCCITQKPHEIGERVPVEDGWNTDQAEVIMTFTRTESIDALIAELQDVKAMMNGSYPFEKERIREHELDFDTFLHT